MSPTRVRPRPATHDKLSRELSARSSIEAAQATAERLLAELRGLDFRCYEPLPAEVAVGHLVAGPLPSLTHALSATARLLRSLPGLVGLASAGEADPEPMAGETEAQATAAVEGQALPLRDRFAEEMDALLRPPAVRVVGAPSDIELFLQARAHALGTLHAALQPLREARRERSKWALITAAEEARRKAQKGLRTVFILAVRLLAPQRAAGLFPEEASELQTALAVRAALLGFARDVAGPTATAAALAEVDVGLTLREVRIRLLQLFGERAYHAVRAPDRYALQQLAQRLGAWLDQSWSDFAGGRQILVDVGAFAAGLDRVNGRDILRQHDEAARAAALARLAALPVAAAGAPAGAADRGRRGALVAACEEAQRLAWRDPALDALVQRCLAEAAPLDAAQLQQQAGELGAALAAVNVGA